MHALGHYLVRRWNFSSSSAFWQRPEISWHLELDIIPPVFTRAPFPAEEKELQSMMVPPPYFTVGMVFFGWYGCAVSLRNMVRKFSLVFHFPKWFGVIDYIFARFIHPWMFFHPTPQDRRIQGIGDYRHMQEVINDWGKFLQLPYVSEGFLVASQISFLHVSPSSVEGCSYLVNARWCHSFHTYWW